MVQWFLSSSVLILVIVGLRRLLRGRISLRLQYGLWALVLVRLLVPLNLPANEISVQNIVVKAPVEEVAQIRLPARSYEDAYAQVVQSYESQGVAVEEIDPVTLDTQATERMGSALTLGQVLTGLWAIGGAGVLCFILWSNHRFRRKLRRDQERLEVSWVSLPVYVSGSLDTPCIFGFFRPAIYLTEDMARDETRMRHILEHEMTHFFHADHIFAPLRCLALALHWFNPLVWWAVKLSRKDCELACDEGTIRRLGERERLEYGRTLIRLTCEGSRPGDYVLTATTMLGDKNTIKERIVMIAKKPKTAIYTLVAVILMAALAVGCTFTGPAEEPEEPSTIPSHAVGLSVSEANGLPEQVFSLIQEKLMTDIQAEYPEEQVTANITNVIHGGQQFNHCVYRVAYDLTMNGETGSRECLMALRYSPYAVQPWVLLDSYDAQQEPVAIALEAWRSWYLSGEPVPVSQLGGAPDGTLTFPEEMNEDLELPILEALSDRRRLAFADGEAGGLISELTQLNIGEELPNLRMYQMDYYLVSPEGTAYPVTEYVVLLYTPGEQDTWRLLGLLSQEDADSLAGDYAAGAESFLTTQELRQQAGSEIVYANAQVEDFIDRLQQQSIAVTWSEDPRQRIRPGGELSYLGRVAGDFDWLPAEGDAQTGGPSLTLSAGDQMLVFRSGSDIMECRSGEEVGFYQAIPLEGEALYDTAMRVYDFAHFLDEVEFQAANGEDALEVYLTTLIPARHLEARPESWYRAEEVEVLENTVYEQTEDHISGTIRYALRQKEFSPEGYGNVQQGQGEYEGWLIFTGDYTLERIDGTTWQSH